MDRLGWPARVGFGWRVYVGGGSQHGRIQQPMTRNRRPTHAPLPTGGAVCTFAVAGGHPSIARWTRNGSWSRPVTCPSCLCLVAQYPELARRPGALRRLLDGALLRLARWWWRG